MLYLLVFFSSNSLTLLIIYAIIETERKLNEPFFDILGGINHEHHNANQPH